MRRLLLRCSVALCLLGSGALTAGAATAAAACTSTSKAGFAKVQVWADAGCAGGSLIVPTSGDDDRPDFRAFRNYDGRVYDINNTRSSVSLASGWCVKLFDGANYINAESPLYCAATSATSHYDLSGFDDVASSMRVCPNSVRTQCNKTPTTPPPPPAGTPPPPPPPAEEDPFVTEDPPPGEGEEPAVDPGADPFAQGPPPAEDPFAAPPSGGSDLGPLGPDDGLAFDRAGRSCSGGTTRGAFALRIWLEETGLPQRGKAATYRCSKARRRRGQRQDLHGVGRAVDFKPATKDTGRQLVALLLADDFSLIRRMGIQEIIFDGMVWSAAQPTPILRRYRGRAPHRRDVHIGLSRKGARKQTSFWAGR